MSDLDQQIRSSLERLTDPDSAGSSGVWDDVVARRQRRLRRRAAGVALPIAAVAGLLAVAVPSFTSDGDRTDVATVNDEDYEAPEGDTGTPTTAPIDPAHVDVPTYDLDLPAAELLREETLMAANTDVVLWGDGQGAYLSLTARPGLTGTYGGPSGLGPMVQDEDFPDGAGDVWLSEPEDRRGATMWWVRPSGDLWILRAHWYGEAVPADAEAALRDWALDIKVDGPAGEPYVIGGQSLTLVGFEAAGDRPSRSRVWEYDSHEITLLVIEGSAATGRSNMLERGAPTVTDAPGLGEVWAVGLTFGWEVPGSDDAWATLLVPDALSAEAPDLLGALRSDG